MRKVIYLLIVVLTTSISLGQTKKKIESTPKEMEKDINSKLDSLSKVYKIKIYSYGTVSDEDGITRHFVGYIEGNELKKKIIPKPVK
jgi:hypothetical protein